MIPRVIEMMEGALAQASPSAARESVLKSLMGCCGSVICTQTIDLNAFISGRHREYLHASDPAIKERVIKLNPTWLNRHPFFEHRQEFKHKPYELMNYGEVLNNRYFDSDYFIRMHREAGLSRTSAYTFSPRMPDGKPLWALSFIIEGRNPTRKLIFEAKRLFSVMPMLDNIFGNLEYWDDRWVRSLAYDKVFSAEGCDGIILIKDGRIDSLTNEARRLLCIDNPLAKIYEFLPRLVHEINSASRIGGGHFVWRAPDGKGLRVSVLRQEGNFTLVRLIEGTSAESVLYRRMIQRYGLTLQEFRILKLLAAGSGNRNIASNRNLSLGTVKTYIRRIYQKLCVRNRNEACVIWLHMYDATVLGSE